MEAIKLKQRILLCVGLLIILLITACGEKDSQEGESKDLKNIDVMLDWYPNAVHSFLYVAIEKGYFVDEGLDVSIQFPANPTDPLSLAASGKVTLGFYYQPDVIMAKANENIPVKSVGAVVRSPLNHLVFKKEGPIESPKDLEGKKVGYPGIPLNEALIKTMVQHDGGDPDNVEMVNVEFELGSSVITDKVDAVIGTFVNHEVPVLQHKGYDIDYINPVDYGVPAYSELVVVTNEQTWENEQEEIEAFWRAATKGFEYMEDHPEDALQILLDNQDQANFPLDKAVEMESMEVLLPKMKSKNGFGSQHAESWKETAEWLKEVDLIDDIPEINEIFVNMNE